MWWLFFKVLKWWSVFTDWGKTQFKNKTKNPAKSPPPQPPQNPPVCQNPEYSVSPWILGWEREIGAVLLRGVLRLCFRKTWKRPWWPRNPSSTIPTDEADGICAMGVSCCRSRGTLAILVFLHRFALYCWALSSPSNITDLLQWVRRVLPLKNFLFSKWSVVDEILFYFRLNHLLLT